MWVPYYIFFFILGAILDRFKLLSAHIFVRHGDRTPFYYLPGNKFEPYECNIDPGFDNTDKKLESYVPTMIKYTGKQKAASYFKNWAIFPNRPLCGDTTLTKTGAVQMLKTGQHIGEKYLNQIALFDNNTALTSQIYTRSSETSRTYQSAVAFLYGFLPLGAFNLTNLRIHHSGPTFCSPVHSRQKRCHCAFANILEHKIRDIRRQFIETNTNATELLKTIENLFDYTIHTFHSFVILMDAFSFHACHHQPNPCSAWDSTKCLTGDHYQQIWQLFDKEGLHLLLNSQDYLKKLFHLNLYPVMVEMANRMKHHLEGKDTQEKLVLYSGHDTTVMPLLHILGLYEGKWVRYAARVVIELYKARDNDDKHKHYVRILYDGVDLTHKVSFCKESLVNGLCIFKSFYDFVFTKMLQQFGYTSYYDACSRTRQ